MFIGWRKKSNGPGHACAAKAHEPPAFWCAAAATTRLSSSFPSAAVSQALLYSKQRGKINASNMVSLNDVDAIATWLSPAH
jgi:hypothetical protein